MNGVLLTGRLTRDPEMRTTANGKTVTQLSVEVSPTACPRACRRSPEPISAPAPSRSPADSEPSPDFLLVGCLEFLVKLDRCRVTSCTRASATSDQTGRRR